MEHKTTIKGYDSMKDLAEDIGNLRYDALAEFFIKLSDKIFNDSQHDAESGRTQLSILMHSVSGSLYSASMETLRAWKICEPKMRNENMEGKNEVRNIR